MKILFDTNLWISFMIGRRLSSLRKVLNRHDVDVYVSDLFPVIKYAQLLELLKMKTKE